MTGSTLGPNGVARDVECGHTDGEHDWMENEIQKVAAREAVALAVLSLRLKLPLDELIENWVLAYRVIEVELRHPLMPRSIDKTIRLCKGERVD